MAELNLALRITGDAKSGIAAFRALNTSVEETRERLNQATDRVRELVRAAGAGKLTLLADAQRDADGAAKKLAEAQRQLEYFRRQAEIGGIQGMEAFGRDIERAKDAVAKASAELGLHNERLEKIRATAATAIPEYAKQLDKAKRAAGALKDQMLSQSDALERTRRAMAAQGVDVTRLAAEQTRLNKAQAESAQRMAEWARQAATGGASVRQLAAGQAEYAARARAAAQVDQARQTIGVRAHAAIRAEIDKVNQALATLKRSGAASNTELVQATRRAREQVARLREELNGARTTAQRLGDGMAMISRAFYAFQAALAGGAIIQAVDDMTRLEARLKLSEGSAMGAATAMEGIKRIAEESAAPIRDVAAAYVRFSGSIGKLGVSQEQSLRFTDALAKALKLSGATAEETGAVMRQLSQAFNKGKLSGDEFVTVSEAGGRVLDYLGEQLGKTRGELAAMAEAGELTSAQLLRLGDAVDQINADFAQMPATVGDAFTRLLNSVTTFAAESVVLRGVLAGLAAAIEFVGRNLDAIVAGAAIAGVGALIVSFGGLTGAVTALTGALAAARVALIGLATSHPILLGITAAATLLVAAWDKLPESIREFNASPLDKVQAGIKSLDEPLGRVQQNLDGARGGLQSLVQSMGQQYQAAAGQVQASMAVQQQAVQARYNAEMQAIRQSAQTAQQRQAAEQQALMQSVAQQVEIVRAGMGQRLALLDEEYRLRIEAARRLGGTDQERSSAVRALEEELLEHKRKALADAEQDYRAHVDTLNAEARRHLDEVTRIEADIARLRMSTEERIRSLQQSAMTDSRSLQQSAITDSQAYADRQLQIEEHLSRARQAISAQDFQAAEAFAKKAADLAASNARAVKEGDREVVSQKQAVAEAVARITEAESLQEQALQTLKQRHQEIGQTAAQEADATRVKFAEVTQAVQRMGDELGKGVKLAIDFDDAAIREKIGAIDALLAEKDHLYTIRDNAEEVAGRLKALEAGTRSDHHVQANVAQVLAEINRLKAPTSSTHTVYVRKVETNASGGPVGYAGGGDVFPRRAGYIRGPGTETSDSIPAMLSRGEFVVRAASVRRWGLDFMHALNAGFLPALPASPLRLAAGGLADSGGGRNAPLEGLPEMALNISVAGGPAQRVYTSRDTARSLAMALRDLQRGA